MERRGNNITTKEMALPTNISMLAYQQFSSLIRSQYYVLINAITVIQITTTVHRHYQTVAPVFVCDHRLPQIIRFFDR
jgi:hypothetical protein